MTKPSETSEIILNWLKTEYPQASWEPHGERMSGVIGGITLELRVVPKELSVGIYTKISYRPATKVREVHLADPTSIDDLQEVVRHTIKITASPFLSGAPKNENK
jgi:hypothetical protein